MISIWVDRTEIRRNASRAERGEPLLPTIVVHDEKEITRAFEVEISGPAKLVYRPGAPRQNGVVLWIETESEVQVEHRAPPVT